MKSRVALAVLAALCTSCTGASTTPIVPGSGVSIADPGKPIVYVAVGASETAGSGADIDRIRDPWPAVFYAALPRAAVYMNLGIGGETTRAAIDDELPRARAVHATLATVWLNVDDLIAGVPPDTYGLQLATLLAGLRGGGAAKVLVANTPVLDGLPLVRFCLGETSVAPEAARCPDTLGTRGFTPERLRARVDAYNVVIAQVVRAQRAVLVDLHAQGDVGVQHPDYVDREDGFHPSDRGHAAVAALFETALRTSGGP